nr:hypothetical protein [Tanacetum cinerariifolium]
MVGLLFMTLLFVRFREMEHGFANCGELMCFCLCLWVLESMVKMEVGVNPRTKLGLNLWSSEDVRYVNVVGNVISHYRDKSTNNMGSCETGNVTTESKHINGSNQDGKVLSTPLDVDNNMGSAHINEKTNDVNVAAIFGPGFSKPGILKLYKFTHIRREERKGLPIKVATPQVLTIQGGRNHKPNKKPQAAKGNGKGKSSGKFKLAYSPKPKNPSPAKKEQEEASKQADYVSTSCIFTIELFSFPNKSWVYDTGCGTHICNTTQGLRGERKLKHEVVYMWDWGAGAHGGVSKVGKCLCTDGVQDNSVDEGYVEFFEKNLIPQKASERVVELEEIQDGDTSPSKNTSEHLVEAGSIKPQEDVAPIYRSVRIYRSPERLCLNVEVKEHSLGDLKELTNYKVALSYPKFGKWFDAMNAEMQSMKDNQVWRLVNLPPNAKTIRSK